MRWRMEQKTMEHGGNGGDMESKGMEHADRNKLRGENHDGRNGGMNG